MSHSDMEWDDNLGCDESIDDSSSNGDAGAMEDVTIEEEAVRLHDDVVCCHRASVSN